jgi:hypothetical protein
MGEMAGVEVVSTQGNLLLEGVEGMVALPLRVAMGTMVEVAEGGL